MAYAATNKRLNWLPGEKFRVLTAEQERVLFGRLDCLRRRLEILPGLGKDRGVDAPAGQQSARLSRAARAIRNKIIRANLALVLSLAKRYVSVHRTLEELFSDGVLSLMKAVDKFDHKRGFKFSTYATTAIVRSFSRTIPEQSKHSARFTTGCSEYLDGLSAQPAEADREMEQERTRRAVKSVLGLLEQRERAIICMRFGLDDHGQRRTLEDTGTALGISKERVRQIEVRTLGKLRELAARRGLDLLMN